ncbi:MAG: response regulator transcription factor [Colwellia sp.]|nr:response regulator transcription factor [Colwellia sp.]MCW8866614.1 response regulator transcription factor [Colwellia sp.]MCW9082461.1 response regulator transcription factor [Colwellia sp.]
MKDKILIVEDEADIAHLIQVHLTELDLDCDTCANGEQALTQALTKNYQLILLDVMLPGISGLDICRQLRQENPLQAILMLTSKTSETDRVLGLELGADDYMTKPFSVRELQARVRTHLRRVHALNGNAHNANINSATVAQDNTHATTCIGQLLIDHRYHQVTYKDQAINLTSTEFELIDFFSKHPDQVFSRTQLLDSVWGYNHSGYEHTVNSHINRLRNKLEQDCSEPQIIQTVWGVGYKLNSAGVH